MTVYVGDVIDREDSFVSERIRENLTRKSEMEADLIKADGRHEFYRDILVDLHGVIVSRDLIPTRYGSAFLVDGKWVNPHVRSQTLEKKGYRFAMEQYSAPAKIRHYCSGSGMFGVYNSGVEYIQVGSADDEKSIEITLHTEA